jgi:hypothetical protein
LLPERPNEGGLRGTACAKFLVLIVSLVGVEIELDRGPISYVTEALNQQQTTPTTLSRVNTEIKRPETPEQPPLRQKVRSEHGRYPKTWRRECRSSGIDRQPTI